MRTDKQQRKTKNEDKPHTLINKDVQWPTVVHQKLEDATSLSFVNLKKVFWCLKGGD